NDRPVDMASDARASLRGDRPTNSSGSGPAHSEASIYGDPHEVRAQGDTSPREMEGRGAPLIDLPGREISDAKSVGRDIEINRLVPRRRASVMTGLARRWWRRSWRRHGFRRGRRLNPFPKPPADTHESVFAISRLIPRLAPLPRLQAHEVSSDDRRLRA